MRSRLLATCALLLFVAPSMASAQSATPMRYNEGPGVKLGESLVFHPGVSVEGRYDSNALAQSSANAEGAPYLRLITHLHLATTSPQRRTESNGQVSSSQVNFQLQSAFGYREYFSDVDAVKNQRALEIDAGLRFGWLPSRHFGFTVWDNYARVITPANSVVVQGNSVSSATINQNQNQLAVDLALTPGGGRLSFSLGYQLMAALFENGDVNAGINNRLTHRVGVSGKYKLFPMTALTLDASLSIVRYLDNANLNANSLPLRINLGFVGLVTPRLRVLLKLGYGNGFYSANTQIAQTDDVSFNSVLATAGLEYRIGPRAKIGIKYERRFADSFVGNYYADHTVGLKYDHIVASRFVLHGNVDYIFRAYDGSGADADQNLVTVGVGIDYQIQDWVYVGLGYDLHYQNSSGSFVSSGTTVGLVDFTRHQVYGKVGFSY